MSKIRNILFIMTDQQRWDYLGAAGHESLRTPVLDALAAEGVVFTNAYCNSPICGSSRMCFYTGRYMSSNGANSNGFPLALNQKTLGEHLRPLGMRTTLVGKTHMTADMAGIERLGLDPDDPDVILLKECGFEPFERDDGLWPDQMNPKDLPYNRWLREKGYEGDNPWHDYANSAEGPNGEVLSGWYMRHCHLPARVLEEHSETAYMTDRALEFIDEYGNESWCMHLSYIKPHWPYMAPAPYNQMYDKADIQPAVRCETEREDPHPVYRAYMNHIDSKNFARDEVRENVIPAYMGLITQIDAHLGRVFDRLKETGQWDETLIVFTSDHGDNLGDHWLGEKELFHDCSVRIPLIIRDPRAEADATRGTISEALVESIDLVPTFVQAAGGAGEDGQWIEGRSLHPLLHGTGETWRSAVFAETDYSTRAARHELGVAASEARGVMVRTADWKYVYWHGFRGQLFDIKADPDELDDLGESPQHKGICAELRDQVLDFLAVRRTRVTIDDATIEKRTATAEKRGFLIGYW